MVRGVFTRRGIMFYLLWWRLRDGPFGVREWGFLAMSQRRQLEATSRVKTAPPALLQLRGFVSFGLKANL
jgi:hypothetical protein